MNIFFSYSRADHDIVDVLSSAMRSDGHNVLDDKDINPGEVWITTLANQVLKADAIIPIITENSANNPWVSYEIGAASSVQGKEKAIIIPVVIGNDVRLPPIVAQYQAIFFKNDIDWSAGDLATQLSDVIDRLRLSVSLYSRRREEEAEHKAKDRKESVSRIKSGISRYIDDVFHNLREEEKRNKRYAFSLYFISVFSLVFSVSTVIFFARKDLQSMQIEYVIVNGVVYLSIVIMFISLSKLLFTLAKSFMVEAIRCSDRAHAISFGKFFLDAYGEQATHEEVFKAFNSWNIDNGGTLFRNQSGDDYDPRIIEKIAKILDLK